MEKIVKDKNPIRQIDRVFFPDIIPQFTQQDKSRLEATLAGVLRQCLSKGAPDELLLQVKNRFLTRCQPDRCVRVVDSWVVSKSLPDHVQLSTKDFVSVDCIDIKDQRWRKDLQQIGPATVSDFSKQNHLFCLITNDEFQCIYTWLQKFLVMKIQNNRRHPLLRLKTQILRIDTPMEAWNITVQRWKTWRDAECKAKDDQKEWDAYYKFQKHPFVTKLQLVSGTTYRLYLKDGTTRCVDVMTTDPLELVEPYSDYLLLDKLRTGLEPIFTLTSIQTYSFFLEPKNVLRVPKEFMGLVIGKQGSNIKMIQSILGCQIKLEKLERHETDNLSCDFKFHPEILKRGKYAAI